MNLDTSAGLSFFVLHATDTSTFSGITSFTRIEIVNLNGGVIVASLQINSGDAIRYRIKPAGGSLMGTTETLTLGAGFHDYWFIISPSGVGSWYRGGALKSSVPQPMDPGNYAMRLITNAVVGHFDQVEVTRP